MAATRKIKHDAVNEEDKMQLIGLKGLLGGTSSDSQNNQQVNTTQPVKTVETPVFEETPVVPTPTVPLTQKVQEIDPNSNVITEEKKEVSDTTVGIRMTTAKKREMKAYFIQHGTTMSQGVIDAFALLKKLEDEGKVEYRDGILEIV